MDQSINYPQLTQHTHKRKSHHHDAISQRRASVNEQEGLDSTIANTGTRGSHTQAQVRNGQSPHTAVSAVDVMQSNTIFQNAQGVNISGNTNFHNIGSVTNVYGGGTNDLQTLNGFISFDAQFDSSAQDPDRKCHPETRQNVLKRLRDWTDNPTSTERIFWLYGPAGAGKSAIAQTIARSYARPTIAASFFFFKSDINRNDGNRLFTTLAYQLALSMPGIRGYIADFLSKRPDLPRVDIETQFKQLLARPFHALSDDSIQQLAPVVHVIIETVKKYQKLAPVIIIDGVDECTDEKLQRRFLKVISDAVVDHRFPLRFLIVSRPEVHIEQTIHRFQTPILSIDLAKLDDANRDIEKYLVDEFSRIASEQGLDPTWPGQEIIDDIVYKSSGNFIFASLVIRFVGDTYCFAERQLEIVLKMKPPKTMSPFAILDQLFFEVLGRVPDQEFLKRYLTLLVARISASGDYGELYKDDAVLMHVSGKELHANLRRMRSLLKFEPFIDIHHRSFLDFLHDSSRSSGYHIREQSGIRRYLEIFVDSFVQYVSSAIKKPDHHNSPHFMPRFREIINVYPPKIELPAEVWQEVMQPVLKIQDEFLLLPNFGSTLDFLRCDECSVFYLQRELLELAILKGQPNMASVGEAKNLGKSRGFISSVPTKTEKNTNDNDLDSLLLSLFAHLPETMANCSPTEEVFNLINTVLLFDHAETAKRVRSVSNAQKLVDLLDYMIVEKILHSDSRRKASLLALEIFARVPIVPLSYFLHEDEPYYCIRTAIPIEIWSQTIFANRILDRRYILNDHLKLSMKELRGVISSSVTTIQIMLRLAKAIHYFHSRSVILHKFHSDDIFLDSDNECKKRFSPEDDVFSFGCVFYEMYSGIDILPEYPISYRKRVVIERPSMTEIPEYAWQLIQRCCVEDPTKRPTIVEVQREMEGWHSVRHREQDEAANGMPSRPNVRPRHLEPPRQQDEVANGTQPSQPSVRLRHLESPRQGCLSALCSFLSDLGRSR